MYPLSDFAKLTPGQKSCHKSLSPSFFMTDHDSHLEPLELMQRTQDGDTAAFGELYELYFVPVFRYLYGRLGDRQTAEDLAQTVFLKIFKSIHHFRNQGKSPLAYFLTVARNTLFDFYKKKKDLVIGENVKDGEVNLFNTIKDTEATPEEAWALVENQQQFKKVIDQLRGDQKEVIFLKFIRELSNREIAEILGKKEEAIRQIQCRALKKLRHYLEASPLLKSL
jgi:RNA polymerase sigma-70 factor (ECF subfamily)